MYSARLDETLPRVREAVGEAARKAGRDPSDVTVVAVTKGFPLEAHRAALEKGVRDLAENRAQELVQRVGEIGREECRWHMVGHLQRRKARDILGVCDLLHSLDSLRLARRIERVLPDGADPVPVLVQVNVAGEDSKYGFRPGEAVEAIHEIVESPAFRVRGLMTMAPLTDEERVLRGTFSGLRRIREEAVRAAGLSGEELSMGMSNDFTIAVEEGSTMIRLGTALFGERPT